MGKKILRYVAEWNSGAHGTFVNKTVEPGRNRPCQCGSGKKFKKCCFDKKWAPIREMVIAASLETEKARGGSMAVAKGQAKK